MNHQTPRVISYKLFSERASTIGIRMNHRLSNIIVDCAYIGCLFRGPSLSKSRSMNKVAQKLITNGLGLTEQKIFVSNFQYDWIQNLNNIKL